MPRAKKTSVWAKDGRLYYRWSDNGKRSNAPVGLRDNPTNRTIAERIARRMTEDLHSGNFDRSLARYEVPKRRPPGPSLLDIWADYLARQEPRLSPASWRVLSRTWTRAVEALPTHDLREAPQILRYVADHHAPSSAYRLYVNLKAAGRCAVEAGRIPSNPFEKLRLPSPVQVRRPFPFELDERAAILAALEGHHYGPYVEFLFRTGCRPGEASALHWRDVRGDTLIFSHVARRGAGGVRISEGLKNSRFRRVPMDSKTQALLERIRPQEADSTALVFTGPRGGMVRPGCLGREVWHPLLAELGLEDRPLYCCRHTAITLMLRSRMPVEDVAALVGNTAKMIYQHYVAATKDLRLPEL